MDRTLYVLTGPTAVGKTEWALAWAEARQAEILSCDSLLFYRGMDIGTAKPDAAQRARVPHHLVDVAEVADRFDVVRYVAAARQIIASIHSRGRPVLVVGGSGFYLKCFFSPVADAVEVPSTIRADVDALLANEGIAHAVARLRQINPEGLGTLAVENPRRVARALERCLASGRTLRELEAEFRAQPGPFADFPVSLCRLDREPAELERRIAERVDGMLAAGLIEEVAKLRAAGLEQNSSAASAIGYRETLAHLDGALPRSELRDAIVRDTKALVKKQRTWFRTQLPEHRVVQAGGAVAPGRLFDPR